MKGGIQVTYVYKLLPNPRSNSHLGRTSANWLNIHQKWMTTNRQLRITTYWGTWLAASAAACARMCTPTQLVIHLCLTVVPVECFCLVLAGKCSEMKRNWRCPVTSRWQTASELLINSACNSSKTRCKIKERQWVLGLSSLNKKSKLDFK